MWNWKHTKSVGILSAIQSFYSMLLPVTIMDVW